MKKCSVCGKEKPLSEFRKSRADCTSCDGKLSRFSGHVKKRVCDRLGLTGGDHKTNNMTGWRDYPLEQLKDWITEQREIDKGDLDSGRMKECQKCGKLYPAEDLDCACLDREGTKKPYNRQVTPLRPTIIRPVPLPKLVTVPEREELDDKPTLRMIRQNLGITWGWTCELTGIRFEDCDGAHILARKLCRTWGHPEWIADYVSNAVLVFQPINRAMERGFWFSPDGQYRPPHEEDYEDWMVVLGIPNARIEMNEGRKRFALMASLGFYEEKVSG